MSPATKAACSQFRSAGLAVKAMLRMQRLTGLGKLCSPASPLEPRRSVGSAVDSTAVAFPPRRRHSVSFADASGDPSALFNPRRRRGSLVDI